MRLQNCHSTIREEIDFPVEKADLVERHGAIRLDNPKQGPDTPIADVLTPVGETYEYASADDLYDDLLRLVDESFIGRKFYDDRGPNYHEYDVLSF